MKRKIDDVIHPPKKLGVIVLIAKEYMIVNLGESGNQRVPKDPSYKVGDKIYI